LEKTHKIKRVLDAFFSKAFGGAQPGWDASKSMDSKFEKFSQCTQLPGISGFHLYKTGLLCPTKDLTVFLKGPGCKGS
jgi:hypothetical protein